MATATESDTWIGSSDGDTMCLQVSPGQRVVISAGLMEGSEAVVVQQRSHGRVLVRLEQGVFVEIHQYCLEQRNKNS
jgi:hypothetical protein